MWPKHARKVALLVLPDLKKNWPRFLNFHVCSQKRETSRAALKKDESLIQYRIYTYYKG